VSGCGRICVSGVPFVGSVHFINCVIKMGVTSGCS
jgi:hypothetical protein